MSDHQRPAANLAMKTIAGMTPRHTARRADAAK